MHGMRYYDTTSKAGGNLFMETISGNQVIYNLRADNFTWDTSKRKWKLNGVVERRLNGLTEDVSFEYEVFKKLPFLPSELKRDEFLQARMISPDLQRRIQKERLRGSETVKELEMENAHRTANTCCRSAPDSYWSHFGLQENQGWEWCSPRRWASSFVPYLSWLIGSLLYFLPRVTLIPIWPPGFRMSFLED